MAMPIQNKQPTQTTTPPCADDMVHAVVDYQGLHGDLCIDQHEFTNGDSGRVEAFVADTYQLNLVDAKGQFVRTIKIGKNPQTLWQSVASQVPASGGYSIQPNSNLPDLLTKPGFDGNNQPRIEVSGAEAKAICEAQGKRLPTHLEWEVIASQGGTKEYSTRSGKEDVGVHDSVDGVSDRTRDVCAATGYYIEYGGKELCDMSGNVKEWTYDPLTPGFSFGGSSWEDNYPSKLRADPPFALLPDKSYIRYSDMGFRCVATPQGSTK